jgi:hypothetical protein
MENLERLPLVGAEVLQDTSHKKILTTAGLLMEAVTAVPGGLSAHSF